MSRSLIRFFADQLRLPPPRRDDDFFSRLEGLLHRHANHEKLTADEKATISELERMMRQVMKPPQAATAPTRGAHPLTLAATSTLDELVYAYGLAAFAPVRKGAKRRAAAAPAIPLSEPLAPIRLPRPSRDEVNAVLQAASRHRKRRKRAKKTRRSARRGGT